MCEGCMTKESLGLRCLNTILTKQKRTVLRCESHPSSCREAETLAVAFSTFSTRHLKGIEGALVQFNWCSSRDIIIGAAWNDARPCMEVHNGREE